MYTDHLAKQKDLNLLNEGIVTNYEPLLNMFATQAHPDGKSDVVVSNPTIDADDVNAFTKLLSPEQTEVGHVTTTERNFKFSRGKKIIRYNHSKDHGDNQDLIGYATNKVTKTHWIAFDKMVINGEGANTGLRTATGGETLPSASIGSNTEIVEIANLAKDVMMDNTSSTEDEYIVLVFGQELRSKLSAKSGDSTVKKDLNETLGDDGWMVVPPYITDDFEGFIAFNPSLVTVHHTLTPQVDNQGYVIKDRCTIADFVYGLTGVELTLDGGIVIQPVTFA